VPLFHGLQGRFFASGGLCKRVIVKPYIAVQRRPQIFARSKMLALQRSLDVAVEPFDHAVGLRRSWWGQPGFNTGS